MNDNDEVCIHSIQTGSLPTSTHVLTKGSDCIIIDPAAAAPVLREIRKRGLTATAIINTHGHFDHIGGNGEIKEAFGCPILISSEDSAMLENPSENLSFMGVPVVSPGVDILLEGEMTLPGGIKAVVTGLPGHTRGSVGILLPEEMVFFTGDTLFMNGMGRTDLPGGDMEKMRVSLRLIRGMDPGLRCYPGHGPAFWLGDQFDFIDLVLGGI